MKYKISKAALSDLEQIWLYTFENWSAEQADKYINLILDETEFLSENPQSGEDYGVIRKGYFRSRVKSHFIFYKIKTRQNTIEIIRILHKRMDVDSRIKE